MAVALCFATVGLGSRDRGMVWVAPFSLSWGPRVRSGAHAFVTTVWDSALAAVTEGGLMRDCGP